MGNLVSIKGSIIRRFRTKFVRQQSREKLYSYWRDPNDIWNSPELYLDGHKRSEFLVSLVKKYLDDSDASILDVGCNVGRNFHYLFEAGFTNLSGVEINVKAIEIMKLRFPKLAETCRVSNSSIEDWVQLHSSSRFDLIFSMAVLEHIHKESQWVFARLSKMAKKYLVTIEDEKTMSPRHFPRKYKEIFENQGMTQLEEINCINIPGLGGNFEARVFGSNHT